MFRLSNLVTTLFGVLAALAAWAGIRDIANPNATVTSNPTGVLEAQPGDIPLGVPQLEGSQLSEAQPDESLTRAQRLTRQLSQSAMNLAQNARSSRNETVDAPPPISVAQNPSADFVVQGDGVELTVEPAPPSTPSEATAVQLDPSPNAAPPATVATPAPTSASPASASTPAPVARAPQPPVKAMW